MIAVVSPVFSVWSVSYLSLEYSIFCRASGPELIPTCLPNELRRNCLSELSACLFFFSPPRTCQETHIYTQKWNYRQFESRSFRGKACYWAVQVDELLSPFALYQLVTKRAENTRRREKKEMLREFWLGLPISCHLWPSVF